MFKDNFKIDVISEDLIKINNKNFRFSGTNFYYATQDVFFLAECYSCNKINIYKLTSFIKENNNLKFVLGQERQERSFRDMCYYCIYSSPLENSIDFITADENKIQSFLIFK